MATESDFSEVPWGGKAIPPKDYSGSTAVRVPEPWGDNTPWFVRFADGEVDWFADAHMATRGWSLSTEMTIGEHLAEVNRLANTAAYTVDTITEGEEYVVLNYDDDDICGPYLCSRDTPARGEYTLRVPIDPRPTKPTREEAIVGIYHEWDRLSDDPKVLARQIVKMFDAEEPTRDDENENVSPNYSDWTVSDHLAETLRLSEPAEYWVDRIEPGEEYVMLDRCGYVAGPLATTDEQTTEGHEFRRAPILPHPVMPTSEEQIRNDIRRIFDDADPELRLHEDTVEALVALFKEHGTEEK